MAVNISPLNKEKCV